MPNILKYSNGWGHLIMSLVTMGIGVFLVIRGYDALGASLIGTVVSAWFIPGAAKQVAQKVEDAANTPGPIGPQGPKGEQGPAAIILKGDAPPK